MNLPIFPDFACGQDSCVTSITTPLRGDELMEVTVLLEDGYSSPSDRQLKSIDFLHKVSPSTAQDISIAARNYYRRLYPDDTHADQEIRVDEDNIEHHFSLGFITVPQLGRCDLALAVLSADCDWEREHGMHILLVNGTIHYCGSCSTIFYGKGWKRFISADGENAQLARLREHLAAVP